MPLAAAVGPYLPLLRRFARALSGSQQEGDGHVAATLEAILADRSLFADSLGPKTALYRAFVKVWRARAGVDAVPAQGGAEKTLGAIPTQARLAFLLSALEGFSPPDIAQALDCDEGEALALLAEAAREIETQMRTNVLIIEDEPLIALDLRAIVEQLGHSVETIARTQFEAVRVALNSKPGLILADIQLADGSSGVDAVNEILMTMNAPVIFITAFPERLLTGAAPEPVFLITKPFGVDAVKAAISQALFFDQKARLAAE